MPDTPLNPDALDMRAYDEALLAFKKVSDLYPVQAVALKDACIAYASHLAAALPEVTSVEELDALPLGSTVLGADMIAYQMLLDEGFSDGKSRKTSWWATGNEFEATSIPLPARVLWMSCTEDCDGTCATTRTCVD